MPALAEGEILHPRASFEIFTESGTPLHAPPLRREGGGGGDGRGGSGGGGGGGGGACVGKLDSPTAADIRELSRGRSAVCDRDRDHDRDVTVTVTVTVTALSDRCA